jgi:signal transduction histidine kinase
MHRGRETVRAPALASLLAAGIALVDWRVTPNLSLGFLYLIPLVIAARDLSHVRMTVLAAVCAGLREVFAPFAGSPGMWARLLLVFGVFEALGLLFAELYRARSLAVQHLREKETEMALRRGAEQEVNAIVRTTPLAILTLDSENRVVLANDSARRLLGVEPLEGVLLASYVPALTHLKSVGEISLRTNLQCRAQRGDGSFFLANVWASTYSGLQGERAAVVMWDISDDLRDREQGGFDALMSTSRMLLGGVAHEIRNFAAAASSSYERALRLPGAAADPDFQRLGTVLASLRSIASTGLELNTSKFDGGMDLATALDEARVFLEPLFQDCGAAVKWQIEAGLPLVRCREHGLLQILLNLARNSTRAMERAERKEVRIRAYAEGDRVLISFEDSGPGVAEPSSLFRPFLHPGDSGLGLYVSQAVARSLGGNLRYAPSPQGARFILELEAARCVHPFIPAVSSW